MGESIEDQFHNWVEERNRDAKARAAGMTRIEKMEQEGAAPPRRRASLGAC